MLIGVPFNFPLLRNALRFYHHSLGSRLLINHSDLLTQLCVHDIRILAEMQIFEFFVLWFSVWLYDRGNKELVQIDTIVSKIRNKPLVQLFRKLRKMSIRFKDIDCICCHCLGNVCFYPRHKECPEELNQFCLS